MNITLEKLLNREQKETIIATRLKALGVKGPFKLSYDRRFGWDFEVRKGTRPSVTFSVSVGSPRFAFAVEECARAIREIQAGGTAVALRGQQREGES